MSMRVLLVDDDPAITRAVGRLLRSHEFEVREVNEPISALKTALSFLPHAVILDHRMPALTGSEVAWQFAAEPALKSVPILFCSACADEVHAAKLPSADIPVTAKPLDADFVLAWLRKLWAAV